MINCKAIISIHRGETLGDALRHYTLPLNYRITNVCFDPMRDCEIAVIDSEEYAPVPFGEMLPLLTRNPVPAILNGIATPHAGERADGEENKL